jgi:hypothetical protein
MLLGFALFARKERCGQDSEGASTEQYPHGQQRKDRIKQSPVGCQRVTGTGLKVAFTAKAMGGFGWLW